MREQLEKLPINLSACRNAILYKGGNIGAVAKFNNLAREIDTIPSGDPSYLLVDDTDTTYRKTILSGALPTAKIKSVGGMTYKDEETQTLRDTKVTSLVSHGKNFLPDDVKDASSWVNYKPDWYSYNLDLPNGWYCVSVKLKDEGKGIPYLYLQKSTNGGINYTTNDVAYIGYGYISAGYMTTGNGLENNPLWFKVDNEAGIIYRFVFYTLTQSKLDYIYDMQIEAVELAQEPSTSYPPKTYAPATEYVPYKGVIDTVAIPEAVQPSKGINDTYHDHIEFKEGRVYYHKNVYECVYKKGTDNLKKAPIEGQTTTRFYTTDALFPELSIRKIISTLSDGKKISLCDNLNFVLYEEDKEGYYLHVNSTILYIKSPYTTVEETADWLDGTKFIFALETPEVTDITHLFTSDNYIEVESGGTITAVNEHENPVPSHISYLRRTT